MKKRVSIQMIILSVLLTELAFWSIALSIWSYLSDSEQPFRFENEKILYLLFSVPVFSLMFIIFYRWRVRALEKMGTPETLQEIGASYSGIKSFLRYFLTRNAIALLIIALANPQYGRSKQEIQMEGIDLVIAIDVSNSMMAADMAGKIQRNQTTCNESERMKFFRRIRFVFFHFYIAFLELINFILDGTQ